MWNIFSVFPKTINTLFPPRCFVCKKDGESLCDDCLRKFSRCIDSPAWYIKSTFSFKDKDIRRMIHAMKYYHRKDLIPSLARVMALELKNTADYKSLSPHWILVPIPMPKIRQYLRGYNQASLIAEEISKALSIPVHDDLLVRAHSPKRQVKTLTRSERRRNQHNSFKMKGSARDLDILLVDDVTTTGATLEEARKILIKNGARSIRAVTLAH